MRTFFTGIVCGSLAILVSAGESRPLPDFQPRTVTFTASEMTLDRLLAEIQKQTGNVVEDRRRDTPINFKVKVPESSTFWPMLDTIGKETGIGFSAYQPDGGVALVDSPYHPLKTDYHGIFRFAVKRIDVTRDEETQSHYCEVSLDTAWEPRFKALFINLETAQVDKNKLERQSSFPVSGASATDKVKLRMPAPDRKTLTLESVQGTLRVIGVPSMLEFKFTKLKAGAVVSDKQEGVGVRLPEVSWEKKGSRLSVALETDYPAGAVVKVESFQQADLMDSNRVWLTWGMDPKTRKPYELEPSSQGETQELKTGTRFVFHFAARGNTPLPTPSADVTLHYRTPSRVVAFTVPFSFRGLPLP